MVKEAEVQPVEANQTIFCANPKVAVGGLRDRMNWAARESLLDAPLVGSMLCHRRV
jgi:hypothetical protein